MSDEELRALEREAAAGGFDAISRYMNALIRVGEHGRAVMVLFSEAGLNLESEQHTLLKKRAMDEYYRSVGIDPEVMRQLEELKTLRDYPIEGQDGCFGTTTSLIASSSPMPLSLSSHAA